MSSIRHRHLPKAKLRSHRLTACESRFLVLAAVLACAPLSRAQNGAGETKGIDSGDYNIQQSVEAGYRTSSINGNINTYDTFVNLGSGLRLFDYQRDIRSLVDNGRWSKRVTFS